MTIGWQFFGTGNYANFGEALKAFWSRYKLTRTLRRGIAYFSFIKSGGELREAIGTLRSGNFSYQPKGCQRAFNPNVVTYFDLEKRNWRAVRIDRLIAIN